MIPYGALLAVASPFVLVFAILFGMSMSVNVGDIARKRGRDRAYMRATKRTKASRFRGRFKLSQDGKGGRSANS